MLLEKLKLEVGPVLTIYSLHINPSSYLFKQLEMGLVCHLKMLKTMLSEKLKLDIGPLLTFLFNCSNRHLFATLKCLKQCFQKN